MATPSHDPFANPEPPVVEVLDEPAEVTGTANKRYTRAQAALRARHEQEFIQLLRDAYSEDGAVYQPRLSAAQRAAKAKENKYAALVRKRAALDSEIRSYD